MELACYTGPWVVKCENTTWPCDQFGPLEADKHGAVLRDSLEQVISVWGGVDEILEDAQVQLFVLAVRDELRSRGMCAATHWDVDLDGERISEDEIATWCPASGCPSGASGAPGVREHSDICISTGHTFGYCGVDPRFRHLTARAFPTGAQPESDEPGPAVGDLCPGTDPDALPWSAHRSGATRYRGHWIPVYCSDGRPHNDAQARIGPGQWWEVGADPEVAYAPKEGKCYSTSSHQAETATAVRLDSRDGTIVSPPGLKGKVIRNVLQREPNCRPVW